MIGLQGVRGVVQADPHLFPQGVDADDGARPVGGLHKGIHTGGVLHQVLIGLLLILQAAHEPAAGAGNLGGVQGEVLGLGHLDGDRLELPQKGVAAEGTAADSQAPQHLGLIPNADLPQLNPGVEDRGQALHQAPEVHPSVGGEEEEDFGPLKAALHAHQLHVQFMLQDLLLTNPEGIDLLLPVFLHHGKVFLRGRPDHGAQGRGQLGLGQSKVAPDALGVLQT